MKPACTAAFFLLIAITSLASEVCGCTIPVFRYALDRWETDKFELLLTTDTAADPVIADLLRPIRANGTANLSIKTAPPESGLQSSELRTARLGGQSLWSGTLDATSLALIIDSPARQRLTAQILAGDSIIWVIAHGDTPEDLAEADRIEKRLRFLEQVAALPIQDPNDPDSQLGPGPPLLLKFTTLRVRRDDAAEQHFLKMLAGPSAEINPDTTSFAAAIFGRGRVLGAWALDQLDDTTLEEASMFLIGRCSCRVKDQNPGWDILMNTDWEQALRKVSATAKDLPAESESASAPDETPAPSSAAEPVTVKTDPLPSPAPSDVIQNQSTTLPRWATVGGIALLSITALLLLRSRR